MKPNMANASMAPWISLTLLEARSRRESQRSASLDSGGNLNGLSVVLCSAAGLRAWVSVIVRLAALAESIVGKVRCRCAPSEPIPL